MTAHPSSMKAFLVERLQVNGWRRTSELHWTIGDADKAAQASMAKGNCRGYRVLSVSVGDAVIEQIDPVAGAVGATVALR